MRTFYDLLNTSQGATFQELKHAYFDTLRIVHPDKGAADLEAFGQIQKAYEILKDSEKRKKYDLWLKEQKLREDDTFGIVDVFEWNTCQNTENEGLDFLPDCRCCGDLYLIEKEDLDKIIDFAVFDCSSCSVKLKVVKAR